MRYPTRAVRLENSSLNPLAHPICLSWPRRRTAARAWHGHIPFAMFLVDLLRPRTLVELGVSAGNSYCAFCQAVKELRLDTRCHGVDTWPAEASLDDLREHHDPLYGTFSRLVRSTFVEALPHFGEGTVDLLHIDGCHGDDGVERDFAAWLPKMSAGGVVLLHGTSGGERDARIGRFWDQVKRRYPSFEFQHGQGLGVLAIGDVRSPELRSIFDAVPDEAAKIRRFFVELGRRISLEDDVEGLQRRLDAAARTRRAESVRLVHQVESQTHALHSVTSELAQRGQELAESQRRLHEREHLLHGITSSRGWRALNGYRSLKGRVLLPLTWLRGLWNTRVRQEYRPVLEPIHDLRWLHDRQVWESTGRDPQFNVSRPWPAGWTEVALEIEAEGPVVGHARLYVDRGSGYSERDSYDLGDVGRGRRTRALRLGPDVIALRLDPFESAAWFSVRALALRGRAQPAGPADGADRGAPEDLAAVAGVPALPGFAVPLAIDPYQAWLDVNRWNERRAALLSERLAALAAPPLLSLVIPVDRPAPDLLERAVASVAAQVYGHWELCIVADGGTDPAARETLATLAEGDGRIRVRFHDTDGLATNRAPETARGEFLVLMDPDVVLEADALGEIALSLAEHPDTDVLYADDDTIDAEGRRSDPRFKPDWSPELLLSYTYWGPLLVVRRSVFLKVGGLRPGYEGAQDHDLALRIGEITDRVGHVPKILCHRGPGSESTAASADAGRRAVQDALRRRGARATARRVEWSPSVGGEIFTHEFPDEGPRVAVLIAARNDPAVLQACLESLKKTTYANYEVVVVDNGDGGAETLNRAVEDVEADLVLFLDDAVEIVAPRWLSQMVGYVTLPGVGAVGARLRAPDGTLRHAGIVHGYHHGLAGPAFKGLPASAPGYLSYATVARNCSAVTAACLLTHRELFRCLGGFDASRFGRAYYDLDYGRRLRAAGQRVVYCPTAELLQRDEASRGGAENAAEPAEVHRTYGAGRDPFYNPNLSLRHERFAVDGRTLPPRRSAPIRVLMCAHSLNREGAPYSQFELTAGLKEAGVIEPVVYAPEVGPLLEEYEARGIHVEVFDHPLRDVYDAAAYDQAIALFATWIEALDVELVYGNTRHTFYAIEAAKRLDLPSIWNPRESEPWHTYFDQFGVAIAPLALRCFAYPYRVIFVADATRESCAALATHHNFVTIHTGLDRARFAATLAPWPRARARRELGLGPDEIVCLSMGTVCERKGQMDLIEAIARLPEETATTVRCLVVGNASNEYAARVQAARDALPADRQARVEFVPVTDDVGLYYAASDVFVCTSRIESFPRVILEAMAASLPIVTTPVYGIAEQVRDDVNALCYGPGDVETLAAHIQRLCDEPALRQRLVGNSRHVLDTLNDFDAMVAAYGCVFREAWLSGRSR